MLRVLLVAYHYPPSTSAGIHRCVRFARHLPSLDWKVHVLTVRHPGMPDRDLGTHGEQIHRTRIVRPFQALLALRPRGRPAPSRAGVTTLADEAAVPGKAQGKAWQRWKDSVSLALTFPDREAGWIPFAAARGRSLIRREGIDVVVTSGPPHSSHWIGRSLRRGTGTPWVADFRDPWSAKPWVEAREQRSWREKGIAFLESRVVRDADRVVLNTDALHDEFRSRYAAVPAHRFVCIPNGYDPVEFDSIPTSGHRESPFRLTHTGTLYRRRNPLSLLQAIRRLLDSGAIPRKDFELEMIGPVLLGGATLEQMADTLGLSDLVRHIPSLPHATCLARLHEADALLVVQPDTATQVPGKLYEYLYVGKPILAIASEGATATLVREAGLGAVVNSGDVDGIAEALVALYRRARSGEAGVSSTTRDVLLARHDARALTRELDQVLRGCVSASRACGDPGA